MRKATDVIMGLLVVVAAAAVLLSVFVTETYAQQWSSATFDEIDEDHQALIEEILDKTLNQTADRIVISGEPARMTIIYENITVMNNGNSGA